MTPSETSTASRVERELAREREQRHRTDEAKSGNLSDDDLRLKDARESASSGHLKRNNRGLQK